MKTVLAALSVLLFATVALAKDKGFQHATITSMNSVSCGSQSKSHHKTRELLCHEYVLRSDTTEYHIQQKEEKSAEILAVGKEAEFEVKKDTMRLRAADINGKIRQQDYVIVSVNSRTDVNPPNPQ